MDIQRKKSVENRISERPDFKEIRYMTIENKSKNRYDNVRAAADFGLEKLVKGTEAALAQKIVFQEYKGIVSKNAADWVYGGSEVFGEMGDLVLLSADQISLREDAGRKYKAELSIDPIQGEFVFADCNCNRFRGSGCSCPHIEAVLMAYLIETYGVDSLRETEVERELQRMTGMDDPLIPGVLRKTDFSLNRFRKLSSSSAGDRNKPVWISDPKKGWRDAEGKDKKKNRGKRASKATLSLECILTSIQGCVSVELKVGPGRHYVIRQQQELLKAYRKNLPFSFGTKYTIPAGKEHYSKESAEIMDFFAALYESYDRVDKGKTILPAQGQERRAFLLQGRDLDAYMDLMGGRKLMVDGASCIVDLDHKPAGIEIVKEPHGAIMKLHGETAVGCGFKRMYLRQGDKVFCLPAGQWELRNELIEAGKLQEELYIQNKDLPVICSGIQRMDPKMEQVEVHGFLIQDYLPVQPDIEIYLDYPQEGLISCKVMASYTSTHEKYNLFDEKKGRKFRNLSEERKAAERLWGFFNAFDEEEKQIYYQCDDGELYVFLTETIPLLSEIGQVYVSDSIKRLRVRPAGELAVGLQVDAGNLLISLHSREMNEQEMIQILNAYDRKKHYTRLKNGEFIAFDDQSAETWEVLAEAFKHYGKKNPEAMKIPLYRALYFEEMLGNRSEVILEKGDDYRKLVEQLQSGTSWRGKVPKTLEDVMRGYQKDGFFWMKMLKANGFGGILADDMGLGKTLQVLAFLLSEKEEGRTGDQLRTLIITPASLIYNWKKEVETFTPSLTCKVIAGSLKERREIIRGITAQQTSAKPSETEDAGGLFDTDIYITSYDLLKRDVAEYEDIVFANEIIDEAQFIKNQNTQAAKGVRLIDSRFRLALTGTPIENRLSELWSIFDYLMPGLLYRYNRFRAEYEVPIINNHEQEAMDRLRRMVHPFILRRLKKDVLKDLPDKLEETVTVEMEGEQRKIYDAYAQRLRLFLDKQSDEEFHQGKLEILAELTKLRQICCGPEVFLEEYRGGNAKMEACIELLHQAIEGGHKVLLFSQFTRVLDELCGRLGKEDISYHRIDGSTRKEDRMQMVESFAADEIPVFCISLKAGGTGLNLTAADIVIHYDPWWNVAAQNQATDRTHRIGQKNTVVVYQLIADKTVEQQIVKLQQTKAKLAEDVLSGEGIGSILINKEDLLGLLN